MIIPEWIITVIANYLSDNFEVIMAVVVYFYIGLGVIFAFLQVRDVRVRNIQDSIRRIFHTVVIPFLFVTQAVFLVIITAVYATNYTPKPVLEFSSRVLPTTEWVRSKQLIYFIQDNKLMAVLADGSGRRTVFQADDLIREYQFSPDGRLVLLTTESELTELSLTDGTRQRIETLGIFPEMKKAGQGGVINEVRWSPDGQKLCYRMARWSPFASQEQWVVYDRPTRSKRRVAAAGRKISSLLWAQNGQDLYYSLFEALDTTVYSNPYKLKIYRVPLDTLTPAMEAEILFNEPTMSPSHWEARGIHLDFRPDTLTFGRSGIKEHPSVSPQGSRIAIDEEDFLYYVKGRWWHRRLYEVPRVPAKGDIDRYQYRGGDLAVKHLRWLPDGRYVMMEHYFMGILILEPSSGTIGLLDNQRGNTFGWYTPPASGRPRQSALPREY